MYVPSAIMFLIKSDIFKNSLLFPPFFFCFPFYILPWSLLMSVPLSLYVISTDLPWQGKWQSPVCCSSQQHAGSSLSASPSLLLLWQFSFVFGDNKRENKCKCMAGPPPPPPPPHPPALLRFLSFSKPIRHRMRIYLSMVKPEPLLCKAD